MPFACQRNSYLQTLTSTVKLCEPATLKILKDGKKNAVSGFDVILEDTVLFPEGGGQPDDRGTMNHAEVLRVTRKNCDAVHFVKTPFTPGTEVFVKIDWRRRFDHMQQHSGQHLITAICDSLYNYKTTSWSLGESTSFIELATDAMTPEQVRTVEDAANEEIRKSVPLTVIEYKNKDDEELLKYRCRGLPDDHRGPVRVVKMGDIDHNICCGTHVSNLAHLQIVKLLHAEKGKKSATNLWFVVGDRVNEYFQRCLTTEKALNTILSGPLEQHPELAEKMMKSYKETKKVNQQLLREIAAKEVALYRASPDPDGLISIHRKYGDVDFINAVVNELEDENVVVFVTLGEASGLFFIRGTNVLLTAIEQRVIELLDAKGAVKNCRFQGKANKLKNKTEVESCIRKHLKSTNDQINTR